MFDVERIDREREAAPSDTIKTALRKRRLGAERKTTGELERASTRVDAEEVRELVSANAK